MPNLDDFYDFKMTTTGGGHSGGGNSQNSSENGNIGCSGAFVILMVIIAVLWFIGKVSG